MSKKKREFIIVDKSEYRKELMEQLRENDNFRGLSDSMILQKLMEGAVRNPHELGQLVQDREEDLELQKEIFLNLAEGITTLISEIGKINDRLDRLENHLIPKPPKEDEGLFEEGR